MNILYHLRITKILKRRKNIVIYDINLNIRDPRHVDLNLIAYRTIDINKAFDVETKDSIERCSLLLSDAEMSNKVCMSIELGQDLTEDAMVVDSILIRMIYYHFFKLRSNS